MPERTVVYKHALKVGILPVVSFLGPLAANLLTGSVVVETVFNLPGMGGFFVNSVLNRDGFLLGGVVIVYCVLLVVLNLAWTWLTRCSTGGCNSADSAMPPITTRRTRRASRRLPAENSAAPAPPPRAPSP